LKKKKIWAIADLIVTLNSDALGVDVKSTGGVLSRRKGFVTDSSMRRKGQQWRV